MNVESLKNVSGRLGRTDYLIIFITGVIVVQTEVPGLAGPVVTGLSALPIVTKAWAEQLPALGLLLLVIYSVLPSIYPKWLGEPVKRSILVRSLATVWGFVLAQDIYLSFSSVLSETPGPIWTVTETILGLLLYAAIGGTLMAASFTTVQARPLLSTEGVAIEPLFRISSYENPAEEWRDDIEAIQQKGPRWYWAISIMSFFAIGMLNFVPVIFLGLFVALLSLFYPVIELIAVTRVLLKYWPRDMQRIQLRDIPDLDGEFYGSFDMIRTLPSFAVFLVVFIGIGLSTSMYVVIGSLDTIDPVQWRYFGGAIAELLVSPSVATAGYVIEKGIDVSSHTAFAITPSLMAVYGLWYWMRVVRRIPPLLKTYLEDMNAYQKDPPETNLSCRPRGYLLPLVPLSLLHAHYFTSNTRYLGIALDDLAFLAPWLASVTLLLLTVFWSRSTSPYKNLSSVQREVFLPLLVMLSSLFLSSRDLLQPRYILLALSVYLLINYLFYGFTSLKMAKNPTWWIVGIAVITLTGFTSEMSVFVSLGLSIIVLGLWVFTRQIRTATE